MSSQPPSSSQTRKRAVKAARPKRAERKADAWRTTNALGGGGVSWIRERRRPIFWVCISLLLLLTISAIVQPARRFGMPTPGFLSPSWWLSPVEFRRESAKPLIVAHLNAVAVGPPTGNNTPREIAVVGTGGLVLTSKDSGNTWQRADMPWDQMWENARSASTDRAQDEKSKDDSGPDAKTQSGPPPEREASPAAQRWPESGAEEKSAKQEPPAKGAVDEYAKREHVVRASDTPLSIWEAYGGTPQTLEWFQNNSGLTEDSLKSRIGQIVVIPPIIEVRDVVNRAAASASVGKESGSDAGKPAASSVDPQGNPQTTSAPSLGFEGVRELLALAFNDAGELCVVGADGVAFRRDPSGNIAALQVPDRTHVNVDQLCVVAGENGQFLSGTEQNHVLKMYFPGDRDDSSESINYFSLPLVPFSAADRRWTGYTSAAIVQLSDITQRASKTSGRVHAFLWSGTANFFEIRVSDFKDLGANTFSSIPIPEGRTARSFFTLQNQCFVFFDDGKLVPLIFVSSNDEPARPVAMPEFTLELGVSPRSAAASPRRVFIVGDAGAIRTATFAEEPVNVRIDAVDVSGYRDALALDPLIRPLDGLEAVSLRGVAAESDDIAYAVGTHGTILKTLDSGKSWERITRQWHLDHPDWADQIQPTVTVGQTPPPIRAQYSNGGQRIKLPAPWYYLAVAPIFLLVGLSLRSPPPIVSGPPSIADQLLSDQPLSPGQPDALGLNRIALGLSAFLRNENTAPPLTVAVTGAWGSGKSSLMNLLRADLRRYGIRSVWFNAWHHQQEEVLLASLLQNVRLQAIPPWWHPDGAGFRLRLVIQRTKNRFPIFLAVMALFVLSAGYFAANPGSFSRSSQAMITLVEDVRHAVQDVFSPAGDEDPKKASTPPLKAIPLLTFVLSLLGAVRGGVRAIRAFGVDPTALLASVADKTKVADLEAQTSFRKRFADEFKDVTRALRPRDMVIFIDDLDRCKPENVLEVLEAVNFLVSSGECVVVLGMDDRIVEHFVGLAFESSSQSLPTTQELLNRNTPKKETDASASPPAPDDDAIREARVRDFAKNYMEKLVQIQIPVPKMDVRAFSLTALPAAPAQPPKEPTFAAKAARFALATWKYAAVALVFVSLLALGAVLPSITTPIVSPAAAVAANSPNAGATDKGTAKPDDESKNPPKTDGTTAPVVGDTASTTIVRVPKPQPSAHVFAAPAPFAAWPWILITAIAIIVIIAAALYFISLSPNPETFDSEEFSDSVEAWLPAVFDPRSTTPRAVKRFMNRIRFLAMLQREPEPFASPEQRLSMHLEQFFRVLERVVRRLARLPAGASAESQIAPGERPTTAETSVQLEPLAEPSQSRDVAPSIPEQGIVACASLEQIEQRLGREVPLVELKEHAAKHGMGPLASVLEQHKDEVPTWRSSYRRLTSIMDSRRSSTRASEPAAS